MNLVIDMVDPRYRNLMQPATRLRIVRAQDNALVGVFVVNRAHMRPVGPHDFHPLPNSRKEDAVGRAVGSRQP